MKRAALLLMLVVLLVLAMLMSPASGQTAIPPEATPEFWPLTFDPTTVTIDPDKPSLVFESQYRCTLTPDAQTVVVHGVGVFDLATGEKRFDLTQPINGFAFDKPLVLARGVGLYDLMTGEVVIETKSLDARLNEPGSYLTDGPTVYDVNTGEILIEYGPTEFVQSAYQWSVEPRWVLVSRSGTRDAIPFTEWELIDAETGHPAVDTLPALGLALDRVSAFSRDVALVAVSGQGVFELETGERRFELPEASVLRFSDDSTLLVVLSAANELSVIDMRTGDIVLRRDHMTFAGQGSSLGLWGGIMLSEDNKTLLVPEFSEVQSGAGSSPVMKAVEIIDVTTGETRAELPSGSLYWFLPGDRRIVVHSQGLFDTATGERLASFTGATRPYFPDDRYVVVQNEDRVTVIDAESGSTVYELSGTLLDFSPSGEWLYLEGQGIYDLLSGELLLPIGVGIARGDFSGDYVTIIKDSVCSIYRLPEAQE